MNYVQYKNGHNIPEELILGTLTALGCKEIVNNDYNTESFKGQRFEGKIPDFICTLNNEQTAVEIGALNQSGPNNKIQDLLNSFPLVIHLFADPKLFMLHSVLYKREQLVSSKILQALEDQVSFCQDLINKLDWKK